MQIEAKGLVISGSTEDIAEFLKVWIKEEKQVLPAKPYHKRSYFKYDYATLAKMALEENISYEKPGALRNFLVFHTKHYGSQAAVLLRKEINRQKEAQKPVEVTQ